MAPVQVKAFPRNYLEANPVIKKQRIKVLARISWLLNKWFHGAELQKAGDELQDLLGQNEFKQFIQMSKAHKDKDGVDWFQFNTNG